MTKDERRLLALVRVKQRKKAWALEHYDPELEAARRRHVSVGGKNLLLGDKVRDCR